MRNEPDAARDRFWLRNESLEDSASRPDPHVLAEAIAYDLRGAVQIESVLGDLQARRSTMRNGTV